MAIARRRSLVVSAVMLGLGACGERATLPVEAGMGPNPQLPPPKKTLIPTLHIAPARGWAEGTAPVPAAGLTVTSFAADLDHPRWLHVLPNGDVLVAESRAPERPGTGGVRGFVMGLVMGWAGAGGVSAERITLLRDADGDGIAEQRSVFLEGLRSPFGMALIGNDFYVANADALMRFRYEPGATRLDGSGEKVLDLPAGRNHHWTKSLIASPDGSRLYVGVGSNSNVAEFGLAEEEGRAAVWEIDPATRRHRIFAFGLRNPVGLAWEPKTGALWTVVNERDEIGSDLVPDYLTSVQDGGFYGWPYSYFGQIVDDRVTPARPDLVAKAIMPDYALGAHTASLGLADATGSRLGPAFAEGMFIGQHGSWNRRPRAGYKVIFVPFVGGKPTGELPRDVLTGFLSDDGEALGRPVGVALDRTGALLVADDVGDRIWRVSSGQPAAQAPAEQTGSGS
jgi:hypothetical protein